LVIAMPLISVIALNAAKAVHLEPTGRA